MKKYTVTLLKDLPKIKAGFTFKITEDFIKAPYLITSQIKDMSNEEFTNKVIEVLLYCDNPEWVKMGPDYSEGIQINCPKCNTKGMFPFQDKELEKEYNCDVTYWYQNVGLECACCGNKIYTHKICVDKKIHW